MNWIGPALAVFGSLVGIFAFIRYIILIEIRLDKNTFRTVYELSKTEKKYMIEEEFFTEGRHPHLFTAICKFEGSPIFYITHSERLLQAGWQGKDFISTVICFRWQYKNLKKYLTESLNKLQLERFGIPVEVSTPYYVDKIGSLKRDAPPPLHSETMWKDIEDEVAEVVAGKRNKTGAILYGPPGNGKTSFIRYLAMKYRLPIKIITFAPEFTNHDIMFMFSQVTPNSIVLLEDFDNYFDGRQCIIGGSPMGGNNMGIKFTFDVILNCLDGVYNTPESVVFFLTANEINKIDYAMKNRPSRFKFVREFGNPDQEVTEKLIGDWSEVAVSSQLNLDQIIRLMEYKEQGVNLSEALVKLGVKENKKLEEKPSFWKSLINFYR